MNQLLFLQCMSIPTEHGKSGIVWWLHARMMLRHQLNTSEIPYSQTLQRKISKNHNGTILNSPIAGVGLFLEHFKSPPSLLKNWTRPHKWLQKNLFPPNIAIPNGTRVSAPAPVSAKPRFTKPRAPLAGVCFPSFGITACASFFTIKSPAVMDTQLT